MTPITFSQWPRDDQAIMWVRIDDQDSDSKKRAPEDWSISRRRSIENGYGQWLAWLAASAPDALQDSPEMRITPDKVGGFYEQLEADAMAPNSIALYLGTILRMAELSDPGNDWDWLRTYHRRRRRQAEDVRPKPTVDQAQLSLAGFQLMETAMKAERPVSSTDALQMRNGLLLALSAARPLRAGDLAGLILGKSLLLGPTSARIEIFNTKGGRQETWLLPDDLLPYLHAYLADFRPRIPGATCHCGLWPSIHGRAMSYHQLWRVVGEITETHCGQRLRPHGIRHSVATSVAPDASGGPEAVRQLLGHAEPETAEEHYNQGNLPLVHRKYQASLNHRIQRLKKECNCNNQKDSIS